MTNLIHEYPEFLEVEEEITVETIRECSDCYYLRVTTTDSGTGKTTRRVEIVI